MSDSEESRDIDDEVYEYTIVRFTHRGRRKKLEEIDIVNSDWLEYDGKRGKCLTKYIDSVANEEDATLLQSLVKSLAPAPASWPLFPVEIVGRANTYENALQKLSQLLRKQNVLTEDSENDCNDIQRKMETAIKQKQLMKKLMEMKTKLSSQSEPLPNTSTLNKEDVSTAELTIEAEPSSSEVNEPLSDNSLQIETRQVNADPMDVVIETTKDQPVMHESADDTNAIQDIPVINLESVGRTEFEVLVLRMLSNLAKEIAEIKAKLKRVDQLENATNDIKQGQGDMVNYLMDKKVLKINETIDFKKYNYSFPLTALEEFSKFDTELTTNKLLKNDMTVHLRELCDRDLVISRCQTRMLKFLVNKDLIRKFTAVRAARSNTEKRTLRFNSTNIYGLMNAIIKYERTKKSLETTDKCLQRSISEVISNTKQWN